MCGPKTTVIVGNEERDASLQQHFVEELGKLFTIKPVRRRKLCDLGGYHDLVQLWICKLRRAKKAGGGGNGTGDGDVDDSQGEQEEKGG